MENSAAELDLKNLVKELSQGRELAKQLRAHLNAQSSSSSSSSSSAFLIQGILYSYDQALSMLMHTRPAGGGEMPPPLATSDSLDSDQDQASRKRGYYRCSYRHGQGWLATKQVQRSDDDPTTLEITYRRNQPDPQNDDPTNEPLFNIQTSLTQDLGPKESPFNLSPSLSNNIFPCGDDIMGNYSSSDKDTSGPPNLLNSDSELSHIFAPITDFNLGNPGYYP